MPSVVCGKGHNSTEADYCSECGVRIDGALRAAGAAPESSPGVYPGEICPDCGTLREQQDRGFCEVCGYNFVTGARGEIPAAAEASALPEMPDEPLTEVVPETEPARGWRLTVTLDPALGSAESPVPPSEFVPASMDLEGTALLIGRGDEARGVRPEVALPFDEAISRRHALLHREAVGAPWQLRDVGASNGTRLNGKQLTALTDYALEDGDEITLGHWTRLRLEGR